MTKSKTQIVGRVFIILHLVGIAGFSFEQSLPLFQLLTPVNLLLSLGLLLWCHSEINPRFIVLSIAVGLLGYLSEVVGVNTGLIFGEYSYGATLGFKVWGTPLLIGVNWLMMIYYTSAIAKKYLDQPWLQVIVASILMALMDLLIEPVAITYDYWSWAGDHIPLQNYLGWFVLSILLHSLYNNIDKTRENGAATYLALAQFIFFLALNIFRTF
ncbi:MAG: carotenoid biosynthesis protein [Bacteroidota bacterium]